MDSNSGGAGQGKEEKWDRDEWRIEESWEYTVTEIWELGNDTYFDKLSKLGKKKTLLTLNDKITQNIHRLFY